jgi:hypothetical protein
VNKVINFGVYERREISLALRAIGFLKKLITYLNTKK